MTSTKKSHRFGKEYLDVLMFKFLQVSKIRYSNHNRKKLKINLHWLWKISKSSPVRRKPRLSSYPINRRYNKIRKNRKNRKKKPSNKIISKIKRETNNPPNKNQQFMTFLFLNKHNKHKIQVILKHYVK